MIQVYTTVEIFVKTLARDVEITLLSNAHENEACPLVIMNDGQNLFEDDKAAYGRSWRILELFELDKDLPKMRVIGISNSQIGHGRLDEYSPFECSDEFGLHGGFGTVGGKGDVYLEWLVTKLIPELRQLYPTTDIYFGGSSMGGFISLYAGLKYPHIFNGIFGLSNAWWFAYQPMIKMIESFEGVLPKIYLDTGSRESTQKRVRSLYVDLHHQVIKALQAKEPNFLIHRVIQKGLHNEEAWGNRVGSILKELL